jgi:hypothetical protein
VGEITSHPGIRLWSRGYFSTGNQPLVYEG